jgi:hypothetical protein
MPEPLSDEDVRRIARETARQTARRLVDIALVLGVTVAALLFLPAIAGYALRAFAPAPGEQGSPLFGLVLVIALFVVAAILIRSWSLLRR